MEYGKYTFLIKLDEDAFLPCYKGSTFRGLFGHALRRVVCALKNQECASCILRSSCTYALVFETASAVSLPEGARISAPPHPVVIEPPMTEKREFYKGDTMECTLLLFGKINRNLPYFVYAFDQMGKIGMGKKIKGKRSKFTLERVSSENELLYSKETKKIKFPDQNKQLNWGSRESVSDMDKWVPDITGSVANPAGSVPAKGETAMEMKIQFKTPLRIKMD
ncbi:MAG TPA: hypothetical protein VJ946_05970, partial [Bacteroidales bacterium]|nr:hypothetical protein [Bacteroidales bacterium]